MTALQDAADATRDALAATLPASVTVVSSQPDASEGATVWCDATDATGEQWRTLVTVVMRAQVDAPSLFVADRNLRTLIDSCYTAAHTIGAQRTGGPYWPGVAHPIAADASLDLDTHDVMVGHGTVTVTVAVPTGHTRTPGPEEQVVRGILADAGLNPSDGTDFAPFTVVRWGGTDSEDPTRALLSVHVASPYESGQIEEHARRVVTALRASTEVIMLDGVDVDPEGTPPGASGIFEVAELMVTMASVDG